MSRIKATKFLPLVGIVIFIYILSRVDLHSVWDTLAGANLVFLAATFLVIVPSLVIKGIKWDMLIEPFGFRFRTLEGTKIWVIGFALGVITPGRIGDFVKAFYVKERGKISMGKSLTTVIVERVLDIVVLFVMGLVGMLAVYMLYSGATDVLYLVLGLFVVFLVLVWMLSKKGLSERMLRPLFNMFVPERHKERVRVSFHDFYAGVDKMKTERVLLVKVVGLTVISWLMNFLQVYVLSLALGLDVPLTFLVMILPIVLLVETLPISFSGVGVRELTLIPLLAIIGVPASSAVSLSLMILIFNYIIAAVGLMFWVKNPVEI